MKEIETDDLYKTYNPRSAGNELSNPDEKFISDDKEVDDENSNLDNDIEDNEEESLEEHQALTPEMIQAMLELPDEELSKYGVDNPKQWKSYQRAFTKANQDKLALERKLAQLESNSGDANKIAELERKIAELQSSKSQPKPLERPIRPVLPKMPANFNYANASEQGTAEYAYMQEKLIYDEKLALYQEQYENYKEATDAQHRQQLENASKITQKTLEQSQIKADMISKLTKLDLTPAEAAAAFEMALKPEFYDEKLIALGFKLKVGKKVEKDVHSNKRTDKRAKFFMPGVSGGQISGANKGEFSMSKDTSNMYKTQKQG